MLSLDQIQGTRPKMIGRVQRVVASAGGAGAQIRPCTPFERTRNEYLPDSGIIWLDSRTSPIGLPANVASLHRVSI